MEINDDEEMRSYQPLKFKRDSEENNELIDPIDLVEPVDAPIDMVGS